MLVVLEGLDGVGKSSTAGKLAEMLVDMGKPATVRSFEKDYFPEAFSSLRGEDQPVARYLIQKAGLFMLAEDLCSEGQPVTICDRYQDSVDAYYQSLPANRREVVPISVPLPSPDLSILIRCEEPIRLQRLLLREKPISERKRRAAFDLAPSILKHLLRSRKWLVVDNSNRSVDETAEEILNGVAEAASSRRC